MEIKVLGTGCAKCNALMNLTGEVVKELNITADIEKVEDINKIISYGVMNTPALVINNKVVLAGRLPAKKELIELIKRSK